MFCFPSPSDSQSCEDSKHMKRLHIYILYYTILRLFCIHIEFFSIWQNIGSVERRETNNFMGMALQYTIFPWTIITGSRLGSGFPVISLGTKYTCSYFREIQNCCACTSGSKVKLKIWAWNWPDKLTWTHVKVLSPHSHSAILYKMLWTWKHKNMQEDVLDNFFLSKMWPIYLVTASVAADKNCDSRINSRRLRKEYW